MKCLNCQEENRESAKFCFSCGSKMMLICSNCNNEMQIQAKFCDECGASLTKQIAGKEDQKPEKIHLVKEEPESERRQLTVMFCDLVGSTKLSEQLDPEELRDLIRDYQSACNKVIRGNEGYIHKYLGDGILAVFGYPKAQEDDVYRAVRGGLAILEGIRNVNNRLESENKPKLAVRIGVHTGLVVIGKMSGKLQIVGETTNLAARIEGIAPTNSLAISEATYKIIKGYFECRSLGNQNVKGISRKIQVFQVLHESGARSRLEISSLLGLAAMIGREQEMAFLIHHWEESVEGRGKVILLEGEVGIGKSRLLYSLKKHVAQDPEAWLTECICSPYHRYSAFFPIINLLETAILHFSESDSQKKKLAKLEGFLTQHGYTLKDHVPILASLLSIPFEKPYAPSVLTPEQRKKKIFAILLSILLIKSENQPILFAVEDLHWIDPSSLEFISLVIKQIPMVRIMALLTFRPQFSAPWQGEPNINHLTISRLGTRHTKRIIENIARKKTLPKNIIDHLTLKTDGVPLFVEELTKMILESDFLEEQDDSFHLKGSLPILAIPDTLKDSLMAKLDRLGTVKELAQLGAVIGREFSFFMLKEISHLNERNLKKHLQELVKTEILYQKGIPPKATYFFKHHMIWDTAYQSLLKSKRKLYHQQVAVTLEEKFSNFTLSQPELLAHHFTQAGLIEKSIEYWYQAGKLAAKQYANKEVIVHLENGLKSIDFIKDSDKRMKLELDFLLLLGPAVMNTKGYSSKVTAQVYNRAKIICRQLKSSSQIFEMLRGQSMFYMINSKFEEGKNIIDWMLKIAKKKEQKVEANHMAASLYFFLGNPVMALKHFDNVIKDYDNSLYPSYTSRLGHDIGVFSLCISARANWILGFPDKAINRVNKGLDLAKELSSPYMIAFAHKLKASIHKLRREPENVINHVEKSIEIATKNGFDWIYLWDLSWHGWALSELGEVDKGISKIKKAKDLYLTQASGSPQGMPHLLASLAEAYMKKESWEDALTTVEEGLEFVAKTGESWYKAELFRLKGKSILHLGKPDAAFFFKKAMSIACSQQAKSWELRVVTSLARLLFAQNKKAEAYTLVQPVYNWFTEGFETSDLKEAMEYSNIKL